LLLVLGFAGPGIAGLAACRTQVCGVVDRYILRGVQDVITMFRQPHCIKQETRLAAGSLLQSVRSP